MSKNYTTTVGDVVLERFTVRQFQHDESGEWEAYVIFKGYVLDDVGGRIPRMDKMTIKNYQIASGSATPYSKSQLIANKDLIFNAFSDWADDMRLELADIIPT